MNLREILAPEWRIDRDRIGMVGFSAGAMLTLATTLSAQDTKPAFIGLIYGPLSQVTVPADAPLFAARDLGRDETLVLAYRTRRALPREAGPAPGAAWVLVPAGDAAARVAAGSRLVAESRRDRGANVALVQTPPG